MSVKNRLIATGFFLQNEQKSCRQCVRPKGGFYCLVPIPVIGWLVGPIITAIITLVCGYYDHLEDCQKGNVITMAQTCFGLIADIAGIITEGAK